MSIRKDEAQLIITIDAKESNEYAKAVARSKELVNNIKKLEVGTDEYNKALQEQVEISKKLSGQDYSKLSIKNLQDRKKALQDQIRILPQVTSQELGLERELQRVNQALSENAARTRAVSQTLNEAGSNAVPGFVGKLTSLLPAMAAFFAIDRIAAFFGAITSGAAQMDGVQNRFDQVFGEAAGLVESFAEQNAINLGLTVQEYKKVTAATGDLLVPMGFAREEAAVMSKEITDLSAALAIWEGGTRSTEEITTILNKALLGEREQLKELGVAISEEDVKNRLRLKGQEKYTGEALKQAKALATLEIITENSGDAIESFAKRTDSASQVQARAGAQVRQLKDDFVEFIQPLVLLGSIMFEKIVTGGIAVIKTLGAIPKFLNDNKVAIASLVAGIIIFNGQMILAAANSLRLATATKAEVVWKNASATAQRLLNAAMTANPIGLVIKAIGLLVAGFGILYSKSETVRAGIAGLGNVAKEIFTIVKESVTSFIDGFRKIGDGDFKGALSSFGDALTKANPISMALTQGKRLKDAFLKGYNDKLAAEAAAKQAEKQAADLVNSVNKIQAGAPASSADIVVTGDGVVESGGTGGKKEKQKKATEKENEDLLVSLAEFAYKKLEQELKQIEEAGKLRQEKLALVLAEEKISEEEYNIQRLRDKDLVYQQELDLLASFGQQESAEYIRIRTEQLNNEKALREARTAQIIEGIEGESEAELTALKEKYLNQLVTEEEFELKKIELEKLYLDQKLARLEAAGLAETEVYKKTKEAQVQATIDVNKKIADDEKRLGDIKEEIWKQGSKALSDTFELGIAILGKDEAAKKKHAGAIKAFEVGNVAINAAAEIQGIWKNANSNPINTLIPGWGPAFAAVQSALAFGRAMVQIRNITAQKFNRSGKILPSLIGSQIISAIPNIPTQSGGDNVLAMVKRGEVVLNEEHQARAGGPAFFRALGVPGFNTGGLISPRPITLPNTSPAAFAGTIAPSSNVVQADPAVMELANSVRALAEIMPESLSNIQANVNYFDVAEKASDLATIQRLASY